MRPIGYYVHHHGDGHRQRALAIAAQAPDRFVLLGTGLAGRTGAVRALDLPDDRLDAAFDGDDCAADRPQALHYAPLGHDGVRARSAAIARWIAAERPALVVVDVSVEVALLVRLCATPVAYVRLGGRRDDAAHLEAFRASDIVIAPFAQALDGPAWPDWIARKSVYAPGIVPRRVDAQAEQGRVLVVCGRGGSSIPEAGLIAAARATPQRAWRVIGQSGDAGARPDNLAFAGWVDVPEREIASAEIVIGAAGDGLVSAVLAARRPFVCIPEPRPFDEQMHKADALQRAGAAIVRNVWPQSAAWPALLDAARAIDPAAQAALDDPEGAAKLARLLIACADRQK